MVPFFLSAGTGSRGEANFKPLPKSYATVRHLTDHVLAESRYGSIHS